MNESNDLAERPPSADIESSRLKKPKYPLHVFFIISNEFCERFMFYGMRSKFQCLKKITRFHEFALTRIFLFFFKIIEKSSNFGPVHDTEAIDGQRLGHNSIPCNSNDVLFYVCRWGYSIRYVAGTIHNYPLFVSRICRWQFVAGN